MSRMAVRFPSIILLVVLVVISLYIHFRTSLSNTINVKLFPTTTYTPLATFHSVALSTHHPKYHAAAFSHMYSRYLAPKSGQTFKLLDLSLTCNSSHGPGPAYDFWLEYLPYVDLHFITPLESRHCIREWATEMNEATIFVGDVQNATFLAVVRGLAGSGYDFVVDSREDDPTKGAARGAGSAGGLFDLMNDDGVYFFERSDPREAIAFWLAHQREESKQISKETPRSAARGIECVKNICSVSKTI